MELSVTYHWYSPETTIRNYECQVQGLALNMTFEQDEEKKSSP